jgi:hypothetical protein
MKGVVVRFPPRLVLAASALCMVAASSGTVLVMSGKADVAPVPVPEITSVSPEVRSPAPSEQVGSAGPAITGAQIAGIALAPARDRAAALIEEQVRAEAERASDEGDDSDDERWDELRDKIREACDDGRLRGPICRST